MILITETAAFIMKGNDKYLIKEKMAMRIEKRLKDTGYVKRDDYYDEECCHCAYKENR